jgi:hypothetical protein
MHQSGAVSIPLPKRPSFKCSGCQLILAAAALYLLTNHVHLFEPRTLPLTWVDRDVPLVPWTIWIYVSEYVYFILIYVLCADPLNLNRYFYSFGALQILSYFFFVLWPTTYPRGDHPLPADLDGATRWMFELLRAADSPANCCPSLHVSSVYLCSWLYLEEHKGRYFWVFFIWGTAIAATTLTTKQHYLADVVAGFVLGTLVHVIFHFWLIPRPGPKPIGRGFRGAKGAQKNSR